MRLQDTPESAEINKQIWQFANQDGYGEADCLRKGLPVETLPQQHPLLPISLLEGTRSFSFPHQDDIR
jgi:hypothetical protein